MRVLISGASRGLPRSAVYIALKTALLSFAQGFEQDLRPHGISVSIIQPGFVEAQMTEERVVKPFVIGPKEAAMKILEGIERNQFQIVFPKKQLGFLV